MVICFGRYWLSSAGVAVHLPFDIPLFVSMNSTGDQKLCFTSKFKVSILYKRGVRKTCIRCDMRSRNEPLFSICVLFSIIWMGSGQQFKYFAGSSSYGKRINNIHLGGKIDACDVRCLSLWLTAAIMVMFPL